MKEKDKGFHFVVRIEGHDGTGRDGMGSKMGGTGQGWAGMHVGVVGRGGDVRCGGDYAWWGAAGM